MEKSHKGEDGRYYFPGHKYFSWAFHPKDGYVEYFFHGISMGLNTYRTGYIEFAFRLHIVLDIFFEHDRDNKFRCKHCDKLVEATELLDHRGDLESDNDMFRAMFSELKHLG